MTKKGIPDRWLPFSKFGKPITGTQFLALKVPLHDRMCGSMEPNDRFTPRMLRENLPKIGMIVDLTNTTRYYDITDFIQNGIQHVKIKCPGRQMPPENQLKQFFEQVDVFTACAQNKDKYIGVHCTHGVNRTGYFICKYMIKKLKFTPKDAIDAFEEARGHKIERQYFIDALFNRPLTKESRMELYGGSNYTTQHYNYKQRNNNPNNYNSFKQNKHKNNQSLRWNANDYKSRNNQPARQNYQGNQPNNKLKQKNKKIEQNQIPYNHQKAYKRFSNDKNSNVQSNPGSSSNYKNNIKQFRPAKNSDSQSNAGTSSNHKDNIKQLRHAKKNFKNKQTGE